jgi:plasmid stabilization system protein ParE
VTHTIRLAPDADRDLVRLGEFLWRANPRAARDARATIVAAIRSLATHPFRGAAKTDDLRQLRVRWGRSGYVIQYRVEPDAVVIARIFAGLERR